MKFHERFGKINNQNFQQPLLTNLSIEMKTLTTKFLILANQLFLDLASLVELGIGTLELLLLVAQVALAHFV